MELEHTIYEYSLKKSDFNVFSIINIKLAELNNRKEIEYVYSENFSEDVKRHSKTYECVDLKTKEKLDKGFLPTNGERKDELDFVSINDNTYLIFLVKEFEEKPTYSLKIKIVPDIKKVVFIREYCKLFDEKNVPWRKLNLFNYSNHKKGTWKLYKTKFSIFDGVLKNISYDHNGLWLLYDKDTIIDKVLVNVTPRYRIEFLIQNDRKLVEYGLDFVKNYDKTNNFLNRMAEFEFEWIFYDNNYNLKDIYNMVINFENEIIKPFVISYEANELLKIFLTRDGVKDNDKLVKYQNGLYYIKKRWKIFSEGLEYKYFKGDTMKVNMVEKEGNEKFEEEYRQNPYYEIIKWFEDIKEEDFLKKKKLNEIYEKEIYEKLIEFIIDRYFSLNKKKIISALESNDVDVKSGTYLLKGIDMALIKSYTNYEYIDTDRQIHYFIPEKNNILVKPEIYFYPLSDYTIPLLNLIVLKYTKKQLIKLGEDINLLNEHEQIINEMDLNFRLTPRNLNMIFNSDDKLGKNERKIDKKENTIKLTHFSGNEYIFDMNGVQTEIMIESKFEVFTFHKFKSLEYSQNDRFFGYSLNPVEYFYYEPNK